MLIKIRSVDDRASPNLLNLAKYLVATTGRILEYFKVPVLQNFLLAVNTRSSVLLHIVGSLHPGSSQETWTSDLSQLFSDLSQLLYLQVSLSIVFDKNY